jgi:chemotaxis protein CheD
MLSSNHQKYFDPKFDAMAVTVLPGDFYVSQDPSEMIVTILGSCVAACIRDKKVGIGGMNHFLLSAPTASIQSESGRYGSFAMEELINFLLKLGCKKENLEAKVFGGASVIQSSFQVGDSNAEFVKEYLLKEKIPIISEDLGGDRPRRIHFWPSSGRVARHLLQSAEARVISMQETTYKKKLEETPKGNGVELF